MSFTTLSDSSSNRAETPKSNKTEKMEVDEKTQVSVFVRKIDANHILTFIVLAFWSNHNK